MPVYAIKTAQGAIVEETAESAFDALDRFAIKRGKGSSAGLQHYERETFGALSEVIGEVVQPKMTELDMLKQVVGTMAHHVAEKVTEDAAPETERMTGSLPPLAQRDMTGPAAMLGVANTEAQCEETVAGWTYATLEFAFMAVAATHAAAEEEWTRKTGNRTASADELAVFAANFGEALTNPHMWGAIERAVVARRKEQEG